VPPGETSESNSSGNASFFFTVTPWRFTSSGSTAWASDTRFCASTFAMSRSVPTSKDTSSDMRPSLEFVDFM
jgi:hypothetical protein